MTSLYLWLSIKRVFIYRAWNRDIHWWRIWVLVGMSKPAFLNFFLRRGFASWWFIEVTFCYFVGYSLFGFLCQIQELIVIDIGFNVNHFVRFFSRLFTRSSSSVFTILRWKRLLFTSMNINFTIFHVSLSAIFFGNFIWQFIVELCNIIKAELTWEVRRLSLVFNQEIWWGLYWNALALLWALTIEVG